MGHHGLVAGVCFPLENYVKSQKILENRYEYARGKRFCAGEVGKNSIDLPNRKMV